MRRFVGIMLVLITGISMRNDVVKDLQRPRGQPFYGSDMDMFAPLLFIVGCALIKPGSRTKDNDENSPS